MATASHPALSASSSALEVLARPGTSGRTPCARAAKDLRGEKIFDHRYLTNWRPPQYPLTLRCHGCFVIRFGPLSERIVFSRNFAVFHNVPNGTTDTVRLGPPPPIRPHARLSHTSFSRVAAKCAANAFCRTHAPFDPENKPSGGPRPWLNCCLHCFDGRGQWFLSFVKTTGDYVTEASLVRSRHTTYVHA